MATDLSNTMSGLNVDPQQQIKDKIAELKQKVYNAQQAGIGPNQQIPANILNAPQQQNQSSGLFSPQAGTTGGFQFGNALQTAIDRMNTINPLTNVRQQLIKHLYDSPLSQQDIANLPPEYQQMVQSGNRQELEMGIRLLNDQISNRQGTLDQSVNFLTNLYTTSQANLETERQDAIKNVISFVGQYGSQAPEALKALYGDKYVSQLKDIGIDIEGMANLSTISQQRYVGSTADNYIVNLPTGTIASQTNNPLNIKYSNTMSGFGAENSGISATDGGTFSSFNSPAEGIQAGIDLLKSNYGDLTVEQAMRKWSNNAYGAEISQIDAAKKISQLSTSELDQLVSDMAKRESGATVQPSISDVQSIAQGIESGMQPPVLTGLYGKSAAVRAQLQRDGFDLAKATLDWQAVIKFTAAANSTAQLRMKQAEASVENSLGALQEKVDKLEADGTVTGFKFVNRASLTSAANGLFGEQAAQDAQALIGQISLITDELGQTFMGGNSPTDAAFELAKGVLASNFTASQFKTQIELIKQNLQYRKNSWANVGATSVAGGTNQYTQQSTTENVDFSKMTDQQLKDYISKHGG